VTKYDSVECSGGEWELGDGPFTYSETILDDHTNEPVDLLDSNPVVHGAIVPLCNGKEVPDRLWVMDSLALLVSSRAREVVSQFSVSADVGWIPTSVVRPNGASEGSFFLGHSTKFHEIIDYSKADCAWLPGRQPGTRDAVAYVRRPVIDPECIPNNLDLFMAMDVFWTCSESLMIEMTAEGLTGFEFVELQSS
jgi:hypothetical protein